MVRAAKARRLLRISRLHSASTCENCAALIPGEAKKKKEKDKQTKQEQPEEVDWTEEDWDAYLQQQ